MENQTEATAHPRWHLWLAIALVCGALIPLLIITPSDSLERAGLVCSAVCHRYAGHTIEFAGTLLPLCARCTGTFLGSLLGLIGQAVVLGRRRASSFPSTGIMAVLIGFSLLWAFDGLNSMLDLRSGVSLYAPRNELRLITGALHGLTMSGLILPLFNFALLENPSDERAIRGWRDLGVLVLLNVGLVALVLGDWPPLLYPLALLSAAGVLTMLTLINSVLVMMVARWENRYHSLREAAVPILLGFVVSLAQITLLDLVRYAVIGNLAGMTDL